MRPPPLKTSLSIYFFDGTKTGTNASPVIFFRGGGLYSPTHKKPISSPH